MSIEILDIFYIVMIAVIFAFIVHIEAHIKQLRTMMDEHVKYSNTLADLACDLKNGLKQEKKEETS